MKDVIEFQLLEYGSDLQKKSIALRYDVLRAPLGLTYTPEQLAEEAGEIHIAAMLNGEPVAILLFKKINERVLKMRQVAVSLSMQNSGIGSKLVLFAEQYARQQDFEKIELHARDAAKDFYLKLNYSIIGDEFIEVGIPHYKMEKKLG